MSAKQKKAFSDLISRYKKYDEDSSKYLHNYYYTDIDNKGDPELLMITGFQYSAAKTMTVYKIKNGKPVKLASRETYHETLHAYPGHKGIIVITGVDATESVEILYLSKGKFKHSSYGTRHIKNADWFYGHGMLKGYK